jgi:hypothetical protein
MAPEGWARMKDDHDAGHPNFKANTESAMDTLLNNIEEEAMKRVEAGEDLGHEKLLHDVEVLMEDVKAGHFHDFHKNGLDMPKMSFMHRLQKLIDNTKDGRYDN